MHAATIGGGFDISAEQMDMADSRNRFLNWLDNTFQGDGPDSGHANSAPFSQPALDPSKK
jgi:hypothetical protein